MNPDQLDDKSSCTPRLTRKEFSGEGRENAAVAGTLAAAPIIADAFMAPQAIAQASTNACCDGIESVTECNFDTNADGCMDTGCDNSTECL
jgi:hypothetical protein